MLVGVWDLAVPIGAGDEFDLAVLVFLLHGQSEMWRSLGIFLKASDVGES